MNKTILISCLLFSLNTTCFSQDTIKKTPHSNDRLQRNAKNKEKALKDGYHRIYDSQRRLVQDGDVKSGKLFNGKKYVYGENGHVVKVEIWKNGEYVEDGLLQN